MQGVQEVQDECINNNADKEKELSSCTPCTPCTPYTPKKILQFDCSLKGYGHHILKRVLTLVRSQFTLAYE